jgi:pimeloyl-ACP methyl ester carboxylesterase
VSSPGLHVRRTEGEGLPIVLVHGAMDRNTSFAKVAALLAPRPVIRYDRRGYGRSRAAGTGDLATHVDDLLAILGDEPAVVVGHSFGGLVALGAAAAAPALVPSLGSYEAPAPWLDWWPRRADLLAADPRGAAAQLMRSFVGDARWERLPTRWKEARLAEGAAMAHEIAGLAPPDPPFDVDRLTMPVLVGWGSETGARAKRGSEELVGLLPTAEHHVIDGAVHEAPVTDPEGFAAFVRATLRRVPTVAR